MIKSLNELKDLELEKAVLGEILLENSAFHTVSTILNKDCFYDGKHEVIYEVMSSMFAKDENIDQLTLVDALKKSDKLELAGGIGYILDLTSRVNTAVNIESHAEGVRDWYAKRKIATSAIEISNKALSGSMDVAELIEAFENELSAVSSFFSGKEGRAMDEVGVVLMKTTEEKMKLQEKVAGYKTGIPSLDSILLGLEGKKMILIAGRPSMGKTAFADGIAMYMASVYKKAGAIFSLEAGAESLMGRMLSTDTKIPYTKIRTGDLTVDEFNALQNSSVHNLPITIFDDLELSVIELKAVVRKLVLKQKIGWVIVDYLQLMKFSSSSQSNVEQEISNISRAMKSISMMYDIPVIALSQLSRDSEKRGGDKRPMMSDLRHSGSLEQDADIIMFVHRPEVYGWKQDADGNSVIGKAEIIISKNRDGSIGSVVVDYKGEILKFSESEHKDFKELESNNRYINQQEDDTPF